MSKPKIMAMNVCVAPKSAADKSIRARTMMLSDIAPGIQPSPDHDLIFNGGRTLANLNFFNFYVGGAEFWQASIYSRLTLPSVRTCRIRISTT